jgi:hypothetical protein
LTIVVRVLLLLVSFAALAAWAGAQGPPPPLSPADRAKLFKSDRALLDQLIDHGIEMANPNRDNDLDRAQECRKTAKTLANYLERAAKDEQDPDRVAEMTALLTELVRDGLAPNLTVARQTNPKGSPRHKEVVALGETAVKDLDDVKAAIPAGKVGDDEKVKAALAALAALRPQLEQ